MRNSVFQPSISSSVVLALMMNTQNVQVYARVFCGKEDGVLLANIKVELLTLPRHQSKSRWPRYNPNWWW